MVQDDDAEVRGVNGRFYRALTELDMEAMSAIWMHSGDVRCIHPGWELLTGWRDVRASWQAIFDHTEAHLVEPRLLEVQVSGGLGWVSCIERITSNGRIAFTAGTNLYRHTDDGWRMILHHASGVPFEEGSEPASPIH